MKSYIVRSTVVVAVLASLGLAQKLMVVDANGYYQHTEASLTTLCVASIMALLLLASLVKDAISNTK